MFWYYQQANDTTMYCSCQVNLHGTYGQVEQQQNGKKRDRGINKQKTTLIHTQASYYFKTEYTMHVCIADLSHAQQHWQHKITRREFFFSSLVCFSIFSSFASAKSASDILLPALAFRIRCVQFMRDEKPHSNTQHAPNSSC